MQTKCAAQERLCGRGHLLQPPTLSLLSPTFTAFVCLLCLSHDPSSKPKPGDKSAVSSSTTTYQLFCFHCVLLHLPAPDPCLPSLPERCISCKHNCHLSPCLSPTSSCACPTSRSWARWSVQQFSHDTPCHPDHAYPRPEIQARSELCFSSCE